MGCQSKVYIGDNLTFSITTHDPETGDSTVADAPPTYRVYEDDVAIPLLTGTLPAHDAVNTTGFYLKKIACTLANGFEHGKSYNVYIEAAVNLHQGAISYAFLAEDSINLGTGSEEFVYTLTDVVTGLPIPNANIWVTTDVNGVHTVASGDTDAFGQVTFWLDAGVYYFWRHKNGYTFANPDLETVTP